MNKEKKESLKEKLIAGTGASLASAVVSQAFRNDALGGYAKKIEDALKPIRINDKIKLNYHIGGLAKRLPVSGLGTAATLITYDYLKDRAGNDTITDKLKNSVAAGLASAAVTLPFVYKSNKFPTEIEATHPSKLKRLGILLKSRIGQAMIAAPAGLIAYDLVKDIGKKKTDNSNEASETKTVKTLKSIGAGAVSATAGAIAAAPASARYEALVPKAEEQAKEIGNRLGRFHYAFNHKTGNGLTVGHWLGRMQKGSISKIPGAIAGVGTSYVAYDLIKNHLQNKKQ